MRSTLGIRNLNLCFTKIKRPSPSNPEEDQSRPPPLPANSAASILIKNFNSLYDLAFDSTSNSKSLARSSSGDLSSDSDSDTEPTTPDLAAVFASQRFFFATPGRSNSIVDSSSPSTSSSSSSSSSSQVDPPESDALVSGSIAVPTVSPDPYNDFRRSMQEMVEARDLVDVRANWDYLHELLMCYLALNPKSTHKFIVGAFADLLLTLMTFPAKSGDRESEFSGGDSSISRRCM